VLMSVEILGAAVLLFFVLRNAYIYGIK